MLAMVDPSHRRILVNTSNESNVHLEGASRRESQIVEIHNQMCGESCEPSGEVS